MHTDVLIVGAGPTGLMLALQLARRGVRALIIDRLAAPSLRTRALGVQARTLEIYSQLGIADRALELGKRATGANIWARGRRSARIPLGDIGRDISPFPFLLILGQDDNERLLNEELRKHDIAILWGTELVGVAQDAERATAILKSADGTTCTLTAAWVAGCDGARSAVREHCKIEFVGAPYSHVFFVADTEATGAMVPGELNVYLRRQGFHLFFPMRGENHWRVVGILPPHLRGREDLTFDDVVPSVRDEAGSELVFQSCSWYSTYRIHHRRAARFREGRCFLLGDAAHIHSPVGAQGMNTGLQDAYNLAWKLALVIAGRASAELLDSYAAERLPVAMRLLSTTDRAFALIVSDNPLAGILRTRVLAKLMGLVMRRESLRRFAFRTISQTGIRYRRSALSAMSGDLPKGAPRAGDRFPWLQLKFDSSAAAEDVFKRLEDTHFNLIVIGQPVPPGILRELGELLRIHEVVSDPANDKELARVKIPRLAFFLVRPDGYIGMAGSRIDSSAMTRYVSDCLRMRAERG